VTFTGVAEFGLVHDIPVGPDGTFEFEKALQFVVLQGLPEGYFVKSITYGTVDLLKNSLKLDPAAPEAELRIIVGRNTDDRR
jgi:hypothetical protein